MNRRDFFKALGAGAVVIGTPKIIGDAIEAELWTPGKKKIFIPKVITGELFEMDYAAKNIRYIGPNNGKTTVLEFYRWLQDQADNLAFGDDMLDITDQNPAIKATDNIIEMQNNWYIKNPQYLTEGSIQQRGELWAGLKTVGQVEDTSQVFINGKPAIRPGHVNQCVKVGEDKSVIVSVMTPGNYYSKFDINNPRQGISCAALCEGPYYDYGQNPVDKWGKLKPEFANPPPNRVHYG